MVNLLEQRQASHKLGVPVSKSLEWLFAESIEARFKTIELTSGRNVVIASTLSELNGLSGVEPDSVATLPPSAGSDAGTYIFENGAWVKKLEYINTGFARISNVAGTDSAITGETQTGINPAGDEAIFVIEIGSENTLSPVTLNVDGIGDRPLNLNNGADVPVGYLEAGSNHFVSFDGTSFTLFSQGATSALVTAAEAAYANALVSEGVAVAAAGQQFNNMDTHNQISTISFAPVPTHLRTAGFSTVGDDGKDALLMNVATEPTHAAKIQSQDGAWFQIISDPLNPAQMGVDYASAADQSAVMQQWIDYLGTSNSKGIVTGPVKCKNLISTKGLKIEGRVAAEDYLYTGSLTEGILTVNTDETSRIENLGFVGDVNATAGDLLTITAPGGSALGSTGTSVEKCRITYGFCGLNIEKGGEMTIDSNILVGQVQKSMNINNTANGLYGRSHITRNQFYGAGIFNDRSTTYAIFHETGNEVWINNNWFFNYDVMYSATLAQSASMFNVNIGDNHGSDVNLAFYFDASAGALPMGVPAALSNIDILANNVQCLQGIVTVGPAITNGTIIGNQIFPYLNGTGINAKLNGFNVMSNHVDGTQTGGGVSNTTGIIIQNESFQTTVHGTIFSGVTNPYVINTTDPGVLVLDGNDISLNAMTAVAAGPSPWTYTAGPSHETVHVYTNGANNNITVSGQTVANGLSSGNYLPIPLNARSTLTIAYTTAPTVFVKPRM